MALGTAVFFSVNKGTGLGSDGELFSISTIRRVVSGSSSMQELETCLLLLGLSSSRFVLAQVTGSAWGRLLSLLLLELHESEREATEGG